MRNLVGNWTVAPIYTYESPEYATVLSDINSNLNGDSTAIDRTIINPNGIKGTATTVKPQFASNLASLCTPPATTVQRQPRWLRRRQPECLLHPGRRRYAPQRLA